MVRVKLLCLGPNICFNLALRRLCPERLTLGLQVKYISPTR